MGDGAHAVVNGIIRRPVEQKFEGAPDAAVDRPRTVGAVGEWLLVQCGAARGRDAVGHGGEHDGVARVDGHVDHQLAIDHHAAVGLFGVDERSLGCNGDPLRLGAHIEHDGQRSVLGDAELDVVAFEGLEAAVSGYKLVFARIQE